METETITVAEAIERAQALLAAGKVVEAREAVGRSLQQHPDDADLAHFAGVVAYQHGDPEAAVPLLERAAAGASRPQYRNNLGVGLRALGRSDEAAAAFEALIAINPAYTEAWNNLGAVHRQAGRLAQAVDAYRRALAADPGNVQAAQNLRVAYSDAAPTWHFAMMNDVARNQAYAVALTELAPGRHVLDIGTGAGLLAMMAARAGASRVTTCEMVPFVAEAAKTIIASNGYGDRVTLIAKRSTDIDVAADMGEPADLLVTETFSSGLLAEHALPTVEDARARLVKPGAPVIPLGATAQGYLIGGLAIYEALFVGAVSGFDLSAFNEFAPPRVGIHIDAIPHDVLSDDVDLLGFDLRAEAFPAGGHEVTITATRPGRVMALAQWLRLDFGNGATYSNRPRGRHWSSGWTHILYRMPRPTQVNPGDRLQFVVTHDRANMEVNFRRILPAL